MLLQRCCNDPCCCSAATITCNAVIMDAALLCCQVAGTALQATLQFSVPYPEALNASAPNATLTVFVDAVASGAFDTVSNALSVPCTLNQDTVCYVAQKSGHPASILSAVPTCLPSATSASISSLLLFGCSLDQVMANMGSQLSCLYMCLVFQRS